MADLIEGRCEGFFQDLVSKAIAIEMLNQFIRQFDRDLHNALSSLAARKLLTVEIVQDLRGMALHLPFAELVDKKWD